MENMLSRLFDYQKYEKNSRLEKIINSVENRYPDDLQPLSEDILGKLNAAGSVDVLSMRQANKDRE